MPNTTSNTPTKTILLIGASRGLGHAMAAEFLKKGWNVVGTVRDGSGHTLLHDLQAHYQNQLEIEILDICKPDQLCALHQRLSDRKFDILFVNAGTANPDPNQTIGEISTKDFTDLMITNALSPMRVIETLKACVTATGTIGVMSSGQGSIANNETGLRELYRGTKAALNMFMRSFAARETTNATRSRAFCVMAPGWVKTDLGGPDARLTINESIPSLVTVLLEKHGKPGLEYLDYLGRTVPW
ncbi:SDR family NAD(P)-dependent oxidoreductase [Thalassospira mesophila]|uniref:3-oxoacyl-ACP reductase n=1 Tax=Thalassospira mesophila TaxID=1293891 RepID=A0A1Y2KX24_9PROT|nr:SDR family NAD(P)-dependent oxidoreductase [Thalassospira mesophila]OSQ36775.1 3-oxoacyl-ACP reductase [Thalassospira mesophila]